MEAEITPKVERHPGPALEYVDHESPEFELFPDELAKENNSECHNVGNQTE
ncbi:unnamed protein product [marine sediment metagenome]|uniref:Uncharacterized protein n=1 Tax=marine sediment metagenome TaxID=412755 RepID=X1A0U9_9ZZZZ